MHGYQIISELSERTGGVWRPSPGSVYPTLQLLEEQGLITGAEDEGKRVFTLTEAGQQAARAAVGAARAPWEAVAADLRRDLGQVVAAVRQIASAGTSEQIGEAHRLLGGLRRSLYRILAEDSPDGEQVPGPDPL
jgi:DNA-binding PadR family transcriptional regulator